MCVAVLRSIRRCTPTRTVANDPRVAKHRHQYEGVNAVHCILGAPLRNLGE